METGAAGAVCSVYHETSADLHRGAPDMQPMTPHAFGTAQRWQRRLLFATGRAWARALQEKMKVERKKNHANRA